ncbi:hypothetical protein HYDPIDRAFT_110063 [Hydnomerulius pinastri MD-312]|nr:hypothetical protein HYDPIDRAFT_110063 [Hydnomerulius pinastri MD-312]
MNRFAIPRRSILLDARRWPFFGGLVPPTNRNNLQSREHPAMQGTSSSRNFRDVERASFEYDLPLDRENDGTGGNNDGKDKSGTGNPPPSGTGGDTDAQANSDLLSAWTDRLQVLTVVTTFLATMDGELFSLTAVPTNISLPTSTASRELVYSCLSGALIFHVCASILGYVASFALIRYRIVDASEGEDVKLGGVLSSPSGPSMMQKQLITPTRRKMILEPIHPIDACVAFLQLPERLPVLFASRSSRSPPPLSLITRCYYTTLCLTAAGFILALTGILTYAWAGLKMPVGIFSTVCLGLGVGAGIWAISV